MFDRIGTFRWRFEHTMPSPRSCRKRELPIKRYMAKAKKRPHDKQQELKPEMRDLILRFDATDRREESAKTQAQKSKQRRRRGEKSASR